MTTTTRAIARNNSDLAAIAFVALLGLATVFVAGFAQSGGLHGATHDTRHATGFPCH